MKKKRKKKNKYASLGPSPEELLAEMPQSGAGRPMRGTRKPTKTYRPVEDPKLKAQRDRREWVTKVCKGEKRYRSAPPNCALVYVNPLVFSQVVERAVDSVASGVFEASYVNGDPCRGMDVFMINNDHISQHHITHITKVDENYWTLK